MLCVPDDKIPSPLKKLRPNSPESITGITQIDIEDVGRICKISNERFELDIITQELDSLDEDAVFAYEHRCSATEARQGVASSRPPLSGLYPFPKHNTAIERCVFVPPKRKTLELSSDPEKNLKNSPNVMHDMPRPEIAQGARLEATVIQRVAQLKHQGLWSASRLPKVMEPKLETSQHEYLMNEIIWLSTDFTEERRWKKDMAFQLAKAAQTYLVLRKEWNLRCRIAEEQIRMRNASCIAQMMRKWWSDVKQSVNNMKEFSERHSWYHLAEENKLFLTQCSDLAPSWLAQVSSKHYSDTSTYEAFNNKRLCHNAFAISSDGESNDDEWLPQLNNMQLDEMESSSSRSSRSTSSSRAASFMDDSDTSVLGVTELRSVCVPDRWTETLQVTRFQQLDKPDSLNGVMDVGESLPLKLHSSDPIPGFIIDPSVSNDSSGTRLHVPTDSSTFSSEEKEVYADVINSTELENLLSDSTAPLHRVLRPYVDNGWTAQRSLCCTPSGSYVVQDTEANHSPHFSIERDTPSKSVQAEVNLLLSEALLPIEEVVSPAYLQQATFNNENIVTSSVLYQNDALVVNNEHIDQDSMVDDASNSLEHETIDNFRTIMSPPHSDSNDMYPLNPVNVDYKVSCSGQLFHPVDLHAAALSLSPLLRPFALWSEKSASALMTTGWNPTFRARALPSCNLGAVVAWLRQAFARTVPALILSPSLMSGDAELIVAAHLGQLTIPDHGSCNTILTPGSNHTSPVGDWGPHLIVTSRLCLPAWRVRLRNWCPGLKITSLGLGTESEPPGTGRRLRAGVARGAVNICLTTYGAMRARPSRYCRIQWSVVVLDQVHNLLQHLGNVETTVEQTYGHSQSGIKSEDLLSTDANTRFCSTVNEYARFPSLKTEQPTSSSKRGHTIPSLLDLFTSELKFTGHRILISSVPDLCPSLCGYRLYLLSRLLLLKDPVNTSSYHNWVTELFRAAIASYKRRTPQSNGNERPTKRQLNKFMEPFIVRLDEDDEWESLVDEEIISCSMTALQCQLHDAALTTKSARNASKSGDLLDLLRTVSFASRVCSHPCLTASQPHSSKRFQGVLQDLLSGAGCAAGPFVFRVPSTDSPHNELELAYNTPEAVLHAVRSLRESEPLYTTSSCVHLCQALQQQSSYIRHRVASLIPTPDQFESLFNSVDLNCSNGPQSRSRVQSIVLDGHNGINQCNVRFGAPGDAKNDDDFISQIRSKINSHLPNGLPEPMDTFDSHNIVKQLNFASIPVKTKRPRSVSGLQFPDYLLPSVKRRRLDDVDPEQHSSPLKRFPGSEHEKSATCTFPFLGSELLVQLEKEMLTPSTTKYDHQFRKHSGPFSPKQNSYARHIPDNLSGINLSQNQYFNCRMSASTSALHLTQRNAWRCMQSADISDWCSTDTCAIFQFDQRFFHTMRTNAVPSPGKPFRLPEYLHLQLLQDLSIWNLPSTYISRLPIHKLLCSRSPVIASTPRLAKLDSREPVCHTCKLNNRDSAVAPRCQSPSNLSAFNHLPLLLSCLSCSLDLFYPFSERSRWLSSNTSFSARHGCFNHWADSDLRGLTPCGRLFNDSGKFRRLDQLLNTILKTGSKTQNHGGRPRCIYLLAHQNALLDLLEAFLSASSWRSYPRVRFPCDENSLGAKTMLLVDRINSWPRGSCEPLIVLLHSRLAGSLGGLRAGADTNVIVCDVDWRADTTDMLRFLFHSWALNGLVDLSKPVAATELGRPGLRIYRLVSSGIVGSVTSAPSMEACLSRGMACRLLPGAVFLAHTSTSSDSSLYSARVQPNVVSELLSCGPICRDDEIQTGAIKPFIKASEGERDLSCLIKSEAPSCSSSSSGASSFSFYASGNRRRVDQMRIEDDDTTIFREREPLSEELLTRAFELFEDPIDVQAWCFGIAESTMLMNDVFGEHQRIVSTNCSEKRNNSNLPSVGFSDAPLTQPTDTIDPLDLKQELDYSEFETWEVAHYELLDLLSTLDDRFAPGSYSPLTYEEVTPDPMTSIDPMENLWMPSITLDEIPIWEPFLKDIDPATRSHCGQDLLINTIEPHSILAESKHFAADRTPNSLVIDRQINFDDTNWGYESEPMMEHELPPVTLSATTPVVSTLPATGTALKRSESSMNIQNQTEKPPDVGLSSTITSRMSSTGPSLKRRKIIATSSSRRAVVSEQIPPSPSTPDEHTVPMHTAGEDSDVSMVPSPCSISLTSRATNGAREAVPGPVSSNTSCSTGTVVGTGATGNNSSGTVLMTLHSQTGNLNSVSFRLHIPRATYNKEIGSARHNRLRRSNAISTSSSSAAAVAAIAAGAQLTKASSFHVQNPQTPGASQLSNSASVPRYGLTSPGRSVHSGVQNLTASTAMAGRYVTGSQAASSQTPGQNSATQGHVAVNQLHIGKPVEWLPHEEAALYLCISKFQDVTFESSGNGSNNSTSANLNAPNFRLAEFFMNNYVPTRGHRGARQCLLMHARMLAFVATATAALSVNAFNFPQTVSALGLLSGEDGTLSTAVAPLHSGATHGPTGRKVKNKLKSAAAAAAGISGVSHPGSVASGPGPNASPSCGSATDSANAVSRYRTYLAYQYLQSCCSSNSSGTSCVDNTNNSPPPDTSVSTPAQLNQLFANLKAADDSHTRLVRKAVLDSLSTQLMPTSQPYRSTSSRRPIASGLSGSPHMVSLGSTYTTGSTTYSSSGGSSGSVYGHHHGSTSSFTSVPLGHAGHVPTAPALLTHHRHHRHQTLHDQTPSSTSESNIPVGGSASSLSHAGPIIQKNPTHIAALQEHNINPDTLITPAMVIKNKEEREARLRAEALSAANLISCSAASISACTPPTTATTVSTSVYHPPQSNVHSSDSVYSQPGQLSLQLDSGGSGIVATLPLPVNLSGGHLSFAHTSNQRGTNVMLPVRCGFANHSLASASTVISLAHVGGPQQQRILGGNTASSTIGPGQLMSHQSKQQQQQQMLNPALGRLTHFGSSCALDLMGSTGLSTHTVSSSGVIPSGNTADANSIGGGVIAETGPSNIVLPASWRTSSISRNFGVQNSRIPSLSPSQTQSSTGIPVTGTYLTTQVTKSTAPAGYFLQQRPQFLSTTQSSMPTRSILTSHSSGSASPGMVVGGNYGPSITSLPHILRPRSALRGSVIQPAFVRTITATSTSALSVVPHQTGPRLSSNANFAHSRVSLAVSSNSASVSHLLNSRAPIRTQPSAIFQQFRSSNQTVTGTGSAPVTFSFSSSTVAPTDGRHFVGQHQAMPVQQMGNVCVPSNPGMPFSCIGPSDSSNVGNRQSDTESYVVTRFQQPPPQ